MKKDETIEQYGEEEYKRQKEQSRLRTSEWRKTHRDQDQENSRNWSLLNPESVKKLHQEQSRKGGRFYAKKQRYEHTGLQGKRNCIRMKHAHRWRKYKNIIAPESQVHHSWRPKTADYDGVALVEKTAHQHGIIKVIKILEGAITLFTEKEIREQ